MLTRRHLLTAAATAGFAAALPRPLERYDYRRALGSPRTPRGGKTVDVALVSGRAAVLQWPHAADVDLHGRRMAAGDPS